MYSGETLNVEKMKDVSESQRKLVTAILDCIGPGSGTENGQSGLSARLIAAHLLVSALEGEGELQP